MECLGIIEIMLACSGVLITILAEIKAIITKIKKRGENFLFVYWLKTNVIQLALTGLTLIIMFLLAEDMKEFIGFDICNNIGALISGLSVKAVTNSLLKMRKK